jgi:leucyl aminopeptidase (aminopeptidase T)
VGATLPPRLRAHLDRIDRMGSRDVNQHGIAYAANVPTEENCVSPDASAVEGTFRCTRPVLVQGRLLEDVGGELRGGRLVRLDARAATTSRRPASTRGGRRVALIRDGLWQV